MLNITENATLLETVRNMHTELKLCGKPENSLLTISDDLLLYVLSLLRDEVPVLPDISKKEWDELIPALKPHWILPLLYWKVSHLQSKLRPPEDITSQMRNTFLWSLARCFHVERQLRKIVEVFNNSSISVLVLKGQGLARSVYPEPATRPSMDIDLLVCPEEVIRARKILISIGYDCLGKTFEDFQDFQCEEKFAVKKNSKHNRQVELHWALHRSLGHKRDDDIQELFSRSVKIETAGLSFHALHPIDNLIHVVNHLLLTHNQNIRLIWIYDCALIARSLTAEEDWESLIKKTKTGGARIALEHSFKMAQAWAGLKLPFGFDDFSIWPKPTDIDKMIWSNAIQFKDNPTIAFTFKLFFSNNLTPFQKIQRLFRIVFPHPDIMQMTYPPSHRWLIPLSYVRRWCEWFKKLKLF